MVNIKKHFSYHPNGNLDINTWLQKIETTYSLPQIDLLKKSCELAAAASQGLTTFYGQSCLEQGLETAEIILLLQPDIEAIAASIILSTAQQTKLSHEAIQKQLGENVWKLIHPILKFNIIPTHSAKNPSTFRNIILAMASDIRVVLIKLAERTVIMRGIKHINPNERKKLAQETRDIYAPLANRLGIGQLKWELEDLAFHYLNPDIYKKIAGFLAEKRIDRVKRIKEVIEVLKKILKKENITATITGRAKHIYSIYLKQQRKQSDYQSIFDCNAVRILVPTIQDCYTVLSIVHHTWEPITDEFDDYIADPKPNGYRSIHTAVIGPDQKNLEIQIRTHDMHEQAEQGISAHWIYKENKKEEPDYQKKITYLRQLLDWQQDITKDTPPTELAAILSDHVYAFTPAGDIIDLPKGATPLDFAYHIHSALGHRCRGAKINGHIVTLKHPLQTGDRIEILTTPEGAPSRDWLNSDLGYLKTSRAKAKVAQWFRNQEPLPSLEEEKISIPKKRKSFITPTYPVTNPPISEAGLEINGINNLMTRIAKCCKPIPGDAIIGFITQGRGVSIHRKNCDNISRLDDSNRLIAVSWDSTHPGHYYIDIYICAQGQSNILKDISHLLIHTKINLISLNSTMDQKRNRMHIMITIQIQDSTQLNDLIAQLHQLDNMIDIKRINKG